MRTQETSFRGKKKKSGGCALGDNEKESKGMPLEERKGEGKAMACWVLSLRAFYLFPKGEDLKTGFQWNIYQLSRLVLLGCGF